MRFLLSFLMLCMAALGAGEKKAAPTLETPEAVVQQIEELMNDDESLPTTSEKDIKAAWKKRLESVDKLVADFRKRFPESPLRWDVALLEASAGQAKEQLGIPRPKDARPAMAVYEEVLAAPDASPEARKTASGERLMAMLEPLEEGKLPLPDWEKAAEEHIAKFPDDELNDLLYEQRASLIEEKDPARYIPFLEQLAKNPREEVADMGRTMLAAAKQREELKTKPLDLKFKALDGAEVDVANYRGKVVLVQFWATWCGPCMAEMPNVQAAYAKYHEKGFEILGISLDDDEKALKSYLKKKKIAWPQAFDGKSWEGALAKRFGIDSIPALWLVNKQGMIVDFDATEGLGAKVEKLVGEAGPVAPAETAASPTPAVPAVPAVPAGPTEGSAPVTPPPAAPAPDGAPAPVK